MSWPKTSIARSRSAAPFAAAPRRRVILIKPTTQRREDRGAHSRIDGFEQRDDVNFLKHTLAVYRADGPPAISYSPVTITRSPPGKRAYGAEGERLASQGAEP